MADHHLSFFHILSAPTNWLGEVGSRLLPAVLEIWGKILLDQIAMPKCSSSHPAAH
ncbi:hypothetical protein CHELA1G11_10377 [Hyphomicrobiales bacterium]|nr:hypothetical protein CHELA1G11_10377 [Hyphomicrobiales bacterium]CAH1675115.1 hypothetical protein CHELA1G2_13929 [Hyphomicrobiales bacterium]